MDNRIKTLKERLLQKYKLYHMPEIIETEWYLANISVPVLKNQWTAEYMPDVLSMLNTSIANHSLEETVKTLNPELYTIYAYNRILVIHM